MVTFSKSVSAAFPAKPQCIMFSISFSTFHSFPSRFLPLDFLSFSQNFLTLNLHVNQLPSDLSPKSQVWLHCCYIHPTNVHFQFLFYLASLWWRFNSQCPEFGIHSPSCLAWLMPPAPTVRSQGPHYMLNFLSLEPYSTWVFFNVGPSWQLRFLGNPTDHADHIMCGPPVCWQFQSRQLHIVNTEEM